MVDEQKVLDKIDYVRAQCNEMYAQRRYLTPHIFNYMMDCFEKYVRDLEPISCSNCQQNNQQVLEIQEISW